jgi:hypothetical protein
VQTDRKSWTTEDNVFWPETVLPGLVSNARILALESDQITVSDFWNTEDMISEVADELNAELTDARKGDVVSTQAVDISICLQLTLHLFFA